MMRAWVELAGSPTCSVQMRRRLSGENTPCEESPADRPPNSVSAYALPVASWQTQTLPVAPGALLIYSAGSAINVAHWPSGDCVDPQIYAVALEIAACERGFTLSG